MSYQIQEKPKSLLYPATVQRAGGVYIDPADMNPDFAAPTNEYGATTWRFGGSSACLTAVAAPDPDNLPALTLVGAAPAYSSGYLTTVNGLNGLYTPFAMAENFTAWAVFNHLPSTGPSVGRIIFDTQTLAQDSGFLLFIYRGDGLETVYYAAGATNSLVRGYGNVTDNLWGLALITCIGNYVRVHFYGEATASEGFGCTPILQSTTARALGIGPTYFNAAEFDHPSKLKMAAYLPYGVSEAEALAIMDREVAYQATVGVTVTPQS